MFISKYCKKIYLGSFLWNLTNGFIPFEKSIVLLKAIHEKKRGKKSHQTSVINAVNE